MNTPTVTNQERIKQIQQTKWIGYELAQEILEKLEDLMMYPQVHRMPNMLITGETNNGKSSIIKQFIKRNPIIYDENDDFVCRPVLDIEMPPEATQDSIYITILRSLHVPFQINAKKEQKASQVIQVIMRLGIKIIIIDEFHNMLDNTALKQGQVLNTIKYLSNQLSIPIVAVGTKLAHRALLSDSQTANRFIPYKLPKWRINTNYRRLLKSFEKLMKLKKTSNLDNRELATEIMSMSEGWIGEISDIIKLAAIEAIKSGEERITIESLRKLKWLSPSERRMQ